MKESMYRSYDELPLFPNAKAGGPGETQTVGGTAHEWRHRMKRRQWPKRDAVKNYFPLPKEVFSLGVKSGEILVYAYLMLREDRATHPCHPSYKTIGKEVGMSVNTVRKYVGDWRTSGSSRPADAQAGGRRGTAENR